MHGLLFWIIVGLIAGWLAGKVMKGGGYGIVMDIVLGILGGVVGGWLFGMLRLVRRRDNRQHYRGVCWSCDFSVDHALVEESLMGGVAVRNESVNFVVIKTNRAGCRG